MKALIIKFVRAFLF